MKLLQLTYVSDANNRRWRHHFAADTWDALVTLEQKHRAPLRSQFPDLKVSSYATSPSPAPQFLTSTLV